MEVSEQLQNKECIQNFDWEISREEITFKTQA